MHTWLPDAHSQAPSPVCAVLSGVKTTVPLYAILRLLSIILASPAARVGNWMIALGLVSVAIAAFLLLQVRDYKRMFAYSTVEHMGIILTAAGLATRGSDFGAVSQMMNHAITKSLCFYVAGVREKSNPFGDCSAFRRSPDLLCCSALSRLPVRHRFPSF
jgi:hydrogenase-4 component F